MAIILLLVAGFLSSFEAGDSCIDALHQIRTEERLHVVATDVLEDNVLAYTLSDGPRRAEKTAILICQRDIDAVEDETETEDDAGSDVIEPSAPAVDDTSEDTVEEVPAETVVE